MENAASQTSGKDRDFLTNPEDSFCQHTALAHLSKLVPSDKDRLLRDVDMKTLGDQAMVQIFNTVPCGWLTRVADNVRV